ncbi:MAG: hypothetical protein COV74_04690 [Candidatus Omnitrophica bacterium CG11_big_fil_rev_8_21_14_0_20_45_26]|uniref:Uncharacterized protein n=1 Tax=Candidatus Abzuiibacterium crystallinum TaxID=1974748 RepID=A0A2H0LQ23_9BACT|nr:MAG: hypothetical protein COV74_04690 [Candidatus Omnitrophica bacterium CG11_big_fil_rev_8_21_14_0_20_45_26]PIW64060.1 MAG: hypothetical protein COW12_07815 [Candidatus Omnitrophica bacterium CG12_big_fil_rev_8_21_14_0_65_45_16]
MKIRSILSNLHAVLLLLLAFAIAALVYLIASHYEWRIDLTKEEVNSLSRETKQILSEFGKDPIEIHAFYPHDHPFRHHVEDLLEEYRYLDANVKLFFHDPDREPSVSRRLMIDNYGIIVIMARGREARTELATEQAVTNALAKILSSNAKHIYYVTGHTEPNLKREDGTGYRGLLTRLEGERYQVHEINLLQNGIPAGADLVMMSGPHVDLTDEELAVLTQYFNHGGKIILAVDPVQPGEGTHLKKYLSGFGVDLGEDVIVDHLSKEVGADYLVAMLTEFTHHPALKNFQAAVFLPVARSIRAAREVPPDLVVTQLATTSLGSWAETDLADLENGEVNYDEGIDLPGPVSMIAMVESKKGTQKMVVIGDSDFLSNANINLAGNRYFFMQLVSWLLEDSSLVNIKPKEAPQYLLFLTPAEEHIFMFSALIVIPLTFIVAGTIVTMWRRRYQ